MYEGAVNNLNKLKIDRNNIIIIDDNDDKEPFGSKEMTIEQLKIKHTKSYTHQ